MEEITAQPAPAPRSRPIVMRIVRTVAIILLSLSAAAAAFLLVTGLPNTLSQFEGFEGITLGWRDYLTWGDIFIPLVGIFGFVLVFALHKRKLPWRLIGAAVGALEIVYGLYYLLSPGVFIRTLVAPPPLMPYALITIGLVTVVCALLSGSKRFTAVVPFWLLCLAAAAGAAASPTIAERFQRAQNPMYDVIQDDIYWPKNAEVGCSTVSPTVLERFSILSFRREEAPCTPDIACSQATGLLRERGACIPDTPCSRASEDLFQLGACQLENCSDVSEEYLQKTRVADIKFPLCKADVPCHLATSAMLESGSCIRAKCTDAPGELRDALYAKKLCVNYLPTTGQLLPFCKKGDATSDYLSGRCLRYSCAASLNIKWQTASDPHMLEVHPPATWDWKLCYPDAPCSKLPKIFADNGACIPDTAISTTP